MGWFNHQPVQGFNSVNHFSLVLACWANRNTVLVETFCVIFPDPKPGESPSIYSKIHLLSDMFFLGPQPRFFSWISRQFFSVSVTFVPNLFGPKDALLRLLAVSNRHESRPKGFRGFVGTVWSWAVDLEVVSHQWQCHLQFDTSMVDEYDSNTAGGIDCQHFECRGGGGVGVAAVGEAKDGRLGFEKETVGKLLEVLTLAMLEVVFFFGQCYAMGCWGFSQKQLQQNVSEDKPVILFNVLFRTDANLSTPALS